MKPVAIFRHALNEGPGYFATFLEANAVPWQLIAIDQEATIPASPDQFSGLCFMGGPMSVNDPLPWIGNACQLIRDAAKQGVPVIGHCLGGQLMAKAFGGEIARNEVKEIGWGDVIIDDAELASHWLGGFQGKATVFQWHGEKFSIPPEATRLMHNHWCSSQAFVLGPHLALQCHVEMTSEMIALWCNESWEDEVAGFPTLPFPVQTPKQMREEMNYRLPAMRELAGKLYSSWLRGLKRN